MRALTTVLAAVMAFFTLASAAIAGGNALAVKLNHSTRVALRAPARDVVVGNPAIADVAVLDAHSILVIGKGYGTTNLVVTDQLGRTILSTEIVVSPSDENTVSYYRGNTVTSYACAPRCQSAPAAPGQPAQQPQAPAASN